MHSPFVYLTVGIISASTGWLACMHRVNRRPALTHHEVYCKLRRMSSYMYLDCIHTSLLTSTSLLMGNPKRAGTSERRVYREWG